MNDPTRPIDAYKAIIDQLVDEARRYGPSAPVAEKGIYSRAPAHREFNDFIELLSTEQRELLSRMLQSTRDGAFHDLLATLSWWIDCRGLGLTIRGESMPVDLSGMGLHGDYVGRRDAWGWPVSGEDATNMH